MVKSENFFDQTKEQIGKIQAELEATFPKEVIGNFELFVRYSTIEFVDQQGFNTVLDGVEKRLEISEKLNSSESAKEEKELIKDYFETIAPNNLTDNLNNIIEMKALKDKYDTFTNHLSSTFKIHNIVSRYRVGDETFLFLQGCLKDACTDVMSKLKIHNNNLEEYFTFLREAGETKKNINKERLQTRILTTLVAGPIASLAVKALYNDYNPLSETEEKSFKLFKKVEDSWVFGVEKDFYKLSINLKERYSLILYTLFGGLLLKLQKDLLNYGYEIKGFNWENPSININLTDSNRKLAHEWSIATCKNIVNKSEHNELEEASALSKYVCQYIKENPILAEIEIEEKGNLYDMYANLRIKVAILYLEKKYWEISEYEQAIYQYKKILEEVSHLNVSDKLIKSEPSPFELLIRIIIYEEDLSTSDGADTLALFEEHPIFQHKSTKPLMDLYSQYKLGKKKHSIDDFSLDIFDQVYLKTLQRLNINNDEFFKYVTDVYLKEKNEEKLLFETEIQKSSAESINGMLIEAIKTQDVSKVRRLLDVDPDINYRIKGGRRPLLLAIEKKHDLIIDLILKKGPNLNLSDLKGDTALHYAVYKKDPRLVEKLLKLQAEPDVKNHKGATPLLQSTYANLGDSVDHLLLYEADPNLRDEEDIFPLLAAFGKGNMTLVEKLINKTNLEIKSDKFGGTTMLTYASSLNDKGMVESLLRAGADPNNFDYSQKTPLMSAVGGNASPEIVATLVRYGADLNQQDMEGSTALMDAAVLGHLSLVENLVKEGANLNIMDDHGNTALSESIREGHSDIKKFLMDAGAISLN